MGKMPTGKGNKPNAAPPQVRKAKTGGKQPPMGNVPPDQIRRSHIATGGKTWSHD